CVSAEPFVEKAGLTCPNRVKTGRNAASSEEVGLTSAVRDRPWVSSLVVIVPAAADSRRDRR
ncbi:MAG: hypothetical protein L0387_34930, partial [Acidobacteria bacterium]|nr:hypothetical protein [Acidobacteriota bacterium]